MEKSLLDKYKEITNKKDSKINLKGQADKPVLPQFSR
jgi:hypothetical protein